MSTEPTSLRDLKRLRATTAIYDAAVELLATRSYAEISVEEICERAEVGRATFFRIFGTKNGLLVELLRQLADVTRATLDASDATSAADRLQVVQEIVTESWTGSEPGVREMAAEALRAGIPRGGHDTHRDLITLVAEIIGEGQASGEFRSTTLTPDVLGWMFVVNLGVCVMDWLEHPVSGALERCTSETLDFLLTGLQPRG
jgi:AcrR family transcriptional regulator